MPLTLRNRQVGEDGARCHPTAEPSRLLGCFPALPVQIGQAFDCLSLTLEMPFKDSADLPEPIQVGRGRAGRGELGPACGKLF